MIPVKPIQFENGKLILLDQRLLPYEEVYIECNSLEDGFNAIEKMIVRGAPCIGFTGIFSLALWCQNNIFDLKKFKKACALLKSSRPTAVNLAFEIDNVLSLVTNSKNEKPLESIVEFGFDQINLLEKKNTQMAQIAIAELDKLYPGKKLNILTHCNTGFLACGTIGTALGVIQQLGAQNRIENVWVDETRPYLQGSRLTAFELQKLGIPFQIVVEGSSSYLMREKLVDAIFVGADRIVLNGDTANKIGTSSLSIVASYYNVPFYVVAPLSSFDPKMETGDEIEIELRSEDEITKLKNIRISPDHARALNPSFDITSGETITSIICEKGCISKPFTDSIKELFYEN
jgi:methylthioribose-1-phosphate isomerase